MKIQVILEPSDEGGFTAIVPSLPGCIGCSPLPKRISA
ncbi:type II toxin-antitoxin system HicB family antitoxin [Candidatus Kuenenia stuttgartiensis]